jgi:hypothetical protein
MAIKRISDLSLSTTPPLSGSTVVVYNNETYKTTLDTLKLKVVDNTAHTFTESNTFTGYTYINDLNSNNSVFGSSTGSTHNFIGTINSTGFTNNFGKMVVGSGSLTTGTNSESLRVANTNSKNIAAFVGSKDGSSRITVKNTSSNAFASTDFVAQANNGDDVVNFVTMGINSSAYTLGYVGGPNDAYVVNSGKDLYIGTIGSVPNYLAKLKLFSMNDWQNPNITIDNTTGLNLISFNTNSVTSGYTFEFEGNAKFNNDVKIDGKLNISSTNEKTLFISGSTSTISFDYNTCSIFYLSGLTGNSVYNVINVPTTNNNAITLTFLIDQGTTPYILNTLQINSSSVSIKWLNGLSPSGTPNSSDVIGLTLFSNNSVWNVLGSLTTFN